MKTCTQTISLWTSLDNRTAPTVVKQNASWDTQTIITMATSSKKCLLAACMCVNITVFVKVALRPYDNVIIATLLIGDAGYD